MPLIQPPIPQQYIGKALQMDESGNLSGTLTDRFTCQHPVTIIVGPDTWTLSFPSAPDPPCHDPIEAEPLVLDLTPLAKTTTSITGMYAEEPNCWLSSGAGSFIMQENPDGSWYFESSGMRGKITYGNCR